MNTPSRLSSIAPHVVGISWATWYAKLPQSAFATPAEIAAYNALPKHLPAKREIK